MNNNSFINELRAAGLPEHLIDTVIGVGQLKSVKSQTTLIEAGKDCRTIYFILKGAFVCRHLNQETGDKRTISFHMVDFQPFITCIDSYFTNLPTACDLLAISEAEVLAFRKNDLEELAGAHQILSAFYNAHIINALVSEHGFKTKLIQYSSESLYRYIICNYPQIIQKIPSKYIAEFMGISPEWLSKLKHKT
ncbi:CRP-like cAMP-binding protein [Mucilaginibacter frigoritolerans]|jgi:CRP-like cAMP-binding protein|uniref:CRP-like cAMP-binding protein n=1 Tax=Mucilaginibacter frigoritolerans TaxID=652788 RepID=A0A562TM21_9SPHI|nr:Crp/Fnr family transcriptional regulator [Mucilaginibacter frigoritolerans]TWI94552.1 CRP-like cAMP-binding protein [Mucilaginibacter frigoritolerans]